MDPYIGKMLGDRYEILERIGTGGMAVVYKAKCHRLNRLVAVKILKSDLAQDEDFRRRFHAESKAVAMLSHPNIVSVYDVSQSEDVEYIVMELIDGITLKQYMEKRGRLDWRESLHFITQIVQGLAHAHSRGIVHRDIKPQNIMILRDGSVRVADFGIACLENSAQTLTQEALGSVHYISPEQARGDRTDARSDIYSAGVVLYEMLTNRLPFEGDSAVSVAIQHLSAIPLAPREITPSIPEPLELICMKAMAPDLSRRYASAEAMVADLDAFRKNPGVVLDIDLKELHPEEPDEPTRPLRTAAANYRPVREPQREQRPREPQRENRNHNHPQEQPPADLKRIAVVVVAVVLSLVVLFFLARAVFNSMNTSQFYTIPKVVGYTVEEAGRLESVAGTFTVNQVDTRFDDTVPAGVIVSQDPAEGRTTKSEFIINVVVSAGVKSDTMPNVVNQDVQVVERVTLRDLKSELNLTIVRQDSYSDDVTPGYVISTEPAAGEPLEKDGSVILVVSMGPEIGKVPVPTFLGIQLSNVRAQLESMGLVCGEITEEESEQPVGAVIRQSIDNGTEVPQGTVIDFTVSSGPAASGGNGTVISETFALPVDGRETVHMLVLVDGVVQYEGDETCAYGSVAVEITGVGTGTVQVYYDGELWETRTVNFYE